MSTKNKKIVKYTLTFFDFSIIILIKSKIITQIGEDEL